MISVTLKERDPRSGKFVKNELYTYKQIREQIMTRRKAFFTHWLYGRQRRNAIKEVLDVFEELTNLDRPGRHTVPK